MFEPEKLKKSLEMFNIPVQENVSLKDYSTIGVGGPARFFIKSNSADELETILRAIHGFKIPKKIIGKGSNLIISDKGFNGIVILNRSNNFEINLFPEKQFQLRSHHSRFDSQTVNNQLSELDKKGTATVKVDSGVNLQFLINKLKETGIGGLEYFSGIPASIGGAIYMNAHGAQYLIGDLVESAVIFSDGIIKNVTHNYFQFDYDYSVLHETKEIVLTVNFNLPISNSKNISKISKDWAASKKNQPQKSAGCIFRNLTNSQMVKLSLPSYSTGYLIDKKLKLKGKQIGGAKISNQHAAFIENTGNAKAEDVFQLIKLIKETAFAELGIELKEEIEFLGEF